MVKKCGEPKLGWWMLLFVLALVAPMGVAMSEETKKAHTSTPANPAPNDKGVTNNPASAAGATSTARQTQQPLTLPDTTQMTLLIQQHMSALGQAIKTGNFTVLRDLGAQKFQEQNSVVALREKFAPFVEKKLDLTPVILFTPILVSPPSIIEGRLMRLEGYYSTEPKRVHFDLLFEQVAGTWKLFGISARTSSS